MFSATDPGTPDAAGVERVETSVDGGAVWTPGDSLLVQAPADHSSDGAHEVLFRAVDKAVTTPNTQADQSATVQIDTQAPVTVASGNDADWHATPVTVHLAAGDEPVPGAGVESIQYQIDDGDWTETAGAETDVLVDAPATWTGRSPSRLGDAAPPAANVESSPWRC